MKKLLVFPILVSFMFFGVAFAQEDYFGVGIKYDTSSIPDSVKIDQKTATYRFETEIHNTNAEISTQPTMRCTLNKNNKYDCSMTYLPPRTKSTTETTDNYNFTMINQLETLTDTMYNMFGIIPMIIIGAMVIWTILRYIAGRDMDWDVGSKLRTTRPINYTKPNKLTLSKKILLTIGLLQKKC